MKPVFPEPLRKSVRTAQALVTQVMAEVYHPRSALRPQGRLFFHLNSDRIGRGFGRDAFGFLFSNRAAIAALTLATSSLWAAEASNASELQQLRDDVKALHDELQALKSATATNTVTLNEVVAKTENTVSKSDLDALKDIEDESIKRGVGSRYLVSLSGYGILGYTSALGSGEKSSNSFSLSGIGISLSGTLREDPAVEGDVRYKVSVLGSGSPFSLNAGDVWLAYDLKTAKVELEPKYILSLTLGQQLIPYGLDNVSSEDQRPTIRTSQYNQARLAGRDIGFVANGGFFTKVDPATSIVNPILGYTVGVFNGAGANKIDNNNGVDALGRIVLSPFPNYFSTFRNLKFGANWYEGNLGPESGLLPSKRRFGGDISWLRKPFLLTAEYAHTEDGFSNKTDATGLFTGDDYIATLFWTPGTLPDFQPWIRFDHFDQGTPDGVTKISTLGNYSSKNIYSIGFNWFIWQTEPVTRRVYTTTKTERVLKLQVGYDYIDQEQYAAARHQINAVVTYTF